MGGVTTDPPPHKPISILIFQAFGLVVMTFSLWLEATNEGFELPWPWWVILGSVIGGAELADRLPGGGR